MSGDIPDDLEREVEAWFNENIQDEVYSEALHDLMKILDYNDTELWARVYEAEGDQEKCDAENETLKTQVEDMKLGFKAVLEELDTMEDSLNNLRKFIETDILYGEQ